MGRVEGRMMRRFAVVGSPIEHSLSPLLHQTAYAELGIDDAEYTRFEIGAGQLAAALSDDGPCAGIDGFSVTMPGKAEAFAVAHEHDATSALLGVANTLLRLPSGGWRAENHDVYGIAQALRDHGVEQISTLGILGSGATAASALAAGAQLGASTALITARDRVKTDLLVPVAERLGLQLVRIDWADSHRVLEADAAVSALALPGTEALLEAWATIALPTSAQAVLDVLYDPSPPPLAALLRSRGIETADGLDMLVHQADMQLRSMLGITQAPVEAMFAATRAVVADAESVDSPGG